MTGRVLLQLPWADYGACVHRQHTAAAAAAVVVAAARGGGAGAASVSVSSAQYAHKCTVKGCTSKRAKLKGFASLKSLVSHVMIMHSGSAHARQYRDEGWEKRRKFWSTPRAVQSSLLD